MLNVYKLLKKSNDEKKKATKGKEALITYNL
jgi:hypothetical protein